MRAGALVVAAVTPLLAVVARPAHAAAAGPAAVGFVYADLDGDGALSPGDTPLPGVVVALESFAFARTDADGRYRLPLPRDGILWVHVPDGFQPGPPWRAVRRSGRDERIDFALRPAAAATEAAGASLTFVHASDTHLGMCNADEARAAIDLAVDLAPAPHFLVITGDLTNDTTEEQAVSVDKALAGLPVPFVPVPGNHDWHDGGPVYRRHWGPPMYSFDAGGALFLVLNFNAAEQDQLDFVLQSLELHPPRGPVVVFTHAPPDDEQFQALADLGVDYLFSGHTHSNRVIAHDSLLELNTQMLVMGGFDYTPAGYRVVQLSESGLAVEFRTSVERRVATMVWPREGDCLPPGAPLFAAVEMGAGRPVVTVAIDGGAPTPMRPVGGWVHRAELGPVAPGEHVAELRVRAGGPSGTLASQMVRFCVMAQPPEQAPVADWPQLGGGPGHQGFAPAPLRPPLRTVWVDAVGGHIAGGSPSVAGGRLFVPVVDYADASAGGVVAWELKSGRRLWEARVGAAVHGTPASDGARVYFMTMEGEVHAVDAESGRALWRVDAGAGLDRFVAWTVGTPLLHQGRLFVNVQGRLLALDAASGRELWRFDAGTDEWIFTRAAPVAVGDLVVANVGRGKIGVIGFDARSGEERWRVGRPAAWSVNASPVSDGERVYVLNLESRLFVLDGKSGAIRWEERLYGKAADWGTGPVATPALAEGTLLVPSPRRKLYALSVWDGEMKWRADATPSVLRALPLKPHMEGFIAAAAVAGDTAWVPGADGRLRAFGVHDGRPRADIDLGVPLVSGVVAAGGYLVVGGYDGTVRVMTPGLPGRIDAAAMAEPGRGGCLARAGVGGAGAAGAGTLLVVGLVRLFAARRRSASEI